jgi:hypothetical protein
MKDIDYEFAKVDSPNETKLVKYKEFREIIGDYKNCS